MMYIILISINLVLALRALLIFLFSSGQRSDVIAATISIIGALILCAIGVYREYIKIKRSAD